MSGHLALGFAKHSALGIWQQLWSVDQASGQTYHADSRHARLLIGKPMRAGNPTVAGTDVREQGTPLVVARDRGPLARIRAARRGSPGCGPTARDPMPRSQARLRAFGTQTRVVFTVERREDGRCRRNSHRRGRPCGGPYRSPPNRRAYFAPRAISTAPGPDNQPGVGAPSRVKSPCQSGAYLGDNPTAKRLGFALCKVDGDRTGPLATRRCQLRQAREGATVAAPSCAEV